MHSVAAIASTQFAVQKFTPSSLYADRVACIAKVSGFQNAGRLVIQAALGRDQVKAVAEKAVDAVIGENANRHIQRAAFVAMNMLVAMPALAEEKGKIFDFNLTLPIIAVQFLLLMVALDNIWFKPVSKVMDSRDENIRSKLVGVRDNSAELKALQSEAEGILKAARAETSTQLLAMKKAVCRVVAMSRCRYFASTLSVS